MDYPNIFLIVFDTLRKDVLPIHGGNASTPNLNEFSKDSVIFNNAIAPAPWTVPSHYSFFTGLYPREHNIHEDFEFGDRNIIDKIFNFDGETITKKLSTLGYNIIGYSANPWLLPYSGFDRYFNFCKYYDATYASEYERFLDQESKKYGNNKIKIAINLLKKGKIKELNNFYKIYRNIHKKQKESGFPIKKGGERIMNDFMDSSFEEPSFIFMNLMEVHDPNAIWELGVDDRKNKYQDFAKIKTISEKNLRETKEGYLKSLKYLDDEFGKLIKNLKRLKIYDQSLIIIISDHGQSFKENYKYQYYGHGNFLYDELVEVPMIIKYPQNKKFEIKNGYQSLVNIPKVIENVISGNIEDNITELTAFSEVFGCMNDLEMLTKNNILPKDFNYKEYQEKIFYPRKAIFKNGYKLVINGFNGEIEEFTYNKKSADPREKKEIIKDLKYELYIFKGNEKFVI